ncbi:hypothetical protein FRC06_008735, partial [Ceratobasidium sp. 370]
MARHARYVIGLAAGALCLLLFLTTRVHPPAYLSRSHHAPPPPVHTLTPIQTKLEAQEDAYYNLVQNRHSLIRKFGPTPDKLQP